MMSTRADFIWGPGPAQFSTHRGARPSRYRDQGFVVIQLIRELLGRSEEANVIVYQETRPVV